MSTLTAPMAQQALPAWRQQGVPSLLDTDERVRDYVNRHVNPMSPRWRWHTQRAALNLWFYLGRQWIEAMAELAPGQGSYHFREVYRHSVASFPRPVTNIIAPAVDNEVSRLSKKEYVPDTSVGKNEPEWLAAARLAKDIVAWEMSKALWSTKREQTVFNLVVDSTVGLKTWWDENDRELTLIASPDPRWCRACDALFASARVPAKWAETGMPIDGSFVEMFHKETLVDADEEGEATAVHREGIPKVEMRLCPLHEEPCNLEEYQISEEEAQATDPFGRPMGALVPRGDGMIDVVSVHEYFPENGGVGIEPHEQSVFRHAYVRPLEWIALRFPEIADKLVPQEPRELLRVHPLYSDYAFVGRHVGLYGIEVYTNHAMVKEVVVQPQPHIDGLQQGACFWKIGEEIVRRPLTVDVESRDGRTHQIPRVKYHFARFKRIPKSFYSRSFVDDGIPLQRRLNEIDAQDMDLRERGKPMMWTPQGVELHFRDDLEGSMQVMEYDPTAVGGAWTPKDGLFPGAPLSGASYHAERNQVLSDWQTLGAAQDIELGRAPGSVKTTSGLMLLSEESATKRGPRERGLTEMYEGAFEHVLEMNHAFRQEDQTYEIQSESGILERKSYTGADLVPGVRVKMKARAGYDEMLYNKEATTEGIQMGLIQITSPAARDRALEAMKLPKDINQTDTRQIVLAELAWTNFMRARRVPVVDPTIHDPVAWHDVLANRWISDDAYALQQKANWDAIVIALANWEQRMAQEEALDAQQKQLYGSTPPAQWGAKYSEGQRLRQEALDAQQASQKAAADLQSKLPPGAPAPPELTQAPAPPPEIPPPPLQGFLPEDLGRRIYAVWRRMLPELTAGILAVENAKANKAPLDTKLKTVDLVNQLLQMKAVIEECRILAATRPMPAQPPGMPGAAPPPTSPAPPGQPPGGAPA